MDPNLIQVLVDKILHRVTGYSLLTVHPQPIPVGVSNRHVHLSSTDLKILFGHGYILRKERELSQPGQYAAAEQVTLVGPKGFIERVRILGPVRDKTQVEVSRSDAFRLGLNPPLRDSGNLEGSETVTIVGPKGSVGIKTGMIIAKRHIHMSPADAEQYKVTDGENVQVRVNGERALIFDAVTVRVHKNYKTELHLDIDEANAAGLGNGDSVTLLTASSRTGSGNINNNDKSNDDLSVPKESLKQTQPLTLVTEENVRTAAKNNSPLIARKNAVITPLARDTIKELGVKVITG